MLRLFLVLRKQTAFKTQIANEMITAGRIACWLCFCFLVLEWNGVKELIEKRRNDTGVSISAR